MKHYMFQPSYHNNPPTNVLTVNSQSEPTGYIGFIFCKSRVLFKGGLYTRVGRIRGQLLLIRVPIFYLNETNFCIMARL